MADIGDDLTEARDFMDTTIASMDILLSDARFNESLAISKLQDIRLDARTLSARAIARAAQSVLDSYRSKCAQPKIDGRLMALYKLVAQYAEGLNEIAPIVPDAKSNQTDGSLAEESLEDSYAKARETLIPLIKFSGDKAEALKRLAGVKTQAAAKSSEPQVSFESLMPDVTNAALLAARLQGKSVSLSYAADGLSVANSRVEAVREQLEDIVTHFIRTQIALPSHRQSSGLSRAGHIDITACETSSGLDISVACEGEVISLTPQSEEFLPHSAMPLETSLEMEA